MVIDPTKRHEWMKRVATGEEPPPTKEEPKPSLPKKYPPKTVTQPEIETGKYQKVLETSEEHSELISEEMQRRETTDPYRDMPSTIETIRRVGEIEQAKQRYMGATREWHWAKNIPRGATIYETPTGYRVEHDPSLEFAEQEIRKGEKLPPVIKELYMFGLGVTHTGASFIKPFAQAFQTRPMVFMPKQPLVFPEKVLISPTHFISGTDVIFEPLGLAPPGSTELIGRTGPAGWSGMLVGEAAILAGYSKISKPVTSFFKSVVGETYVKAYPKLPTTYKQFRWYMKRGIADFRFRSGYKFKELVSPYVAGTGWQEIPRNIVDWKFFARGPRAGKFLITTKGKIPLETHIPVRPSADGKIIDVGVVRYGKPKISTMPSKWFTAPRDSYWIKIAQPPKVLYGFPKTLTSKISSIRSKGLVTIAKGKTKTVFTKDVGLTRSFIPSQISTPRIGGFRMPGGWAIATGGVPLEFLEWLEEGTQYIHPRWGKKPIIQPVVSLKPDVMSKDIQDVLSKQEFKVDTASLQFEKSIKGIDIKQDVFKKSAWQQDFEHASSSISIVTPALTSAQTQAQMQKQALALETALVTTPKTVYKPYQPIRTTPTRVTRKIRFPFDLPDEPGKKLKKKLFDIDFVGKGFRIRKHKVPKMKEMVPITEFEKIDIPNVKKIMKKFVF